jgi:deoxyribodipyrimidine photo-lyase
LLVLVGDPEDLIPSLVREYSIEQIYVNKAYDIYGLGRDLRVRLALRDMGVQMHVENDYLLVAPEVLKPYQIFSPYSKAWEKVVNSDTYQLPRDSVALLFPSLDISQLTQKSLDQLPSSNSYRKFQDSSKILKKFDFKSYDEKRNMLGAGGTSKISPYLRFGVISSRQLYHLAHQANNQTFLKELARREFRYQLSYHFPESLVQSFQAKRRGIPRDNDTKLFQAFCQGKT